jgi:RIP metalloprotease RseP
MLGALGQILIYIVPFLLVLTFIVTIHELGHFLVARAFGVKVDRFAIGFGRAIFSRTDRHGIEWRLGWMPLGGYVKFSGDLDASSVPDQAGLAELRQRLVAQGGAGAERDYFHFKPVWQRALIVVAGPAANFILAISIFALVFMTIGTQIRPARVAQIQAGSPAAAAGFQVGDLITGVNGRTVRDGGEVTQTVMLSTGDPVRFTVERGAQTVELVAVPERREENDPIAGRIKVGRIGLGLGASRADSHNAPHTLGDEVDRLQDYLALMAVRMGPRLQVDIQVPDALRNQPVLPLLLQPLAENAIRHGLEPHIDGGTIALHASSNGPHLHLTFSDTGCGGAHEPSAAPAGGPHQGGLGLAHVRERLHTRYGKQARMTLHSPAGQGTRIELVWPLS